MDVPQTLRSMSRFEPSGLIWRNDLRRYLVVSDDTGFKTKNEHAPWLFSMGDDGRVDKYPIILAGVDDVNDLESIASTSDGGLLILSSQGYNKQGKRRRNRTAFLRVEVTPSEYRVTHEAHLAEAIESHGVEYLESLGLSSGLRDLDIEGMVSFEDDIYLGLKSPLDSQERSLIWRLEDPTDFLRSGKLRAGQLSLWGRLRLDARVGNRRVAGGISELLFLPSGELLVTSTPALEGGQEESGALWVVKNPVSGIMTPVLSRWFKGLRPEGLSLSPRPGNIMVAFDNGNKTPMWTLVPWLL